MKFSEFMSESLIVEKNEDKVLQALKKKMQPAIDQAEKMLNDRLEKWGINKKVEVTAKDITLPSGLQIEYWLNVPRDFRVEDAKDFVTVADKAFREVQRKSEKVFSLPFFSKRWNVSFGVLEVSGRGPWRVAQIRVTENQNGRGSLTPEEREVDKDYNSFIALSNLLDEIRLYHDGENLLRYANKAGRLFPEIVKEAKKLARTIKEFKDKAEAEMKKLASQHSDEYIQRHYS